MFGTHDLDHFKVGKTIVCIETLNRIIATGTVKVTIPDVTRLPVHVKDFFTPGKEYPVENFEVRHSDRPDETPQLFIRAQGDTDILEYFCNSDGDELVFTENDFEAIRAQFEKKQDDENKVHQVKNIAVLTECLGNLVNKQESFKCGDIVTYRKDIMTEAGSRELTGQPMVVMKTSFHPRAVMGTQDCYRDVVQRFVVVAFHNSKGDLQFDEVAQYDLTKIGAIPDNLVDDLNEFAVSHLK